MTKKLITTTGPRKGAGIVVAFRASGIKVPVPDYYQYLVRMQERAGLAS